MGEYEHSGISMNKEMIEIRPGRKIIIYQSTGQQENQPCVFLLHGLGGRAAQWQPVAKLLQPYCHLIIPDFYGQGDNAKPKGAQQYKLAEFYQDVDALFARFKGAKNYVFGHSLGGVWASFLAFQHAQSIEKLVLITPLPCQPTKEVPAIYRAPVWLLSLLRKQLSDAFVKMAFTKHSPADLIEQEVKEGEKNSLQVIKTLVLDLQNIVSIPAQQIKVDTLMIVADDDQVVPKINSINFYAGLPNISIKEMSNMGHLPLLEKPEMVAGFIEKFCFSNINQSNP